MPIAALITWVITAALGTYMVATWRKHGGLQGGSATTHLPPVRVFTHLGLAVIGLLVWIVFVVTGMAVWAGVVVADLVLVGLLGAILVRRWIVDGRQRRAGPRRRPPSSWLNNASRVPPWCSTGSSPRPLPSLCS